MPGKRRRRHSVETGFRPSRIGTLRRQQTRGRKRNALVRVPRDKLGFPQSMSSTLRLVTRVDLDLGYPAAAGIAQVAEFSANDLFKPQLAPAGTGQPRSFDEYMTLYDTFTVTSSKCSVNFMLEGYTGPTGENSVDKYLVNPGGNVTESAAVPAIVCGLHKSITEGVVVGPTAQKLMEQDRTQWAVMTAQSQPPTLSNTIKPSDFFGKDALVGSDGYTGTVASSPANGLVWQVWAAPATDSTLPTGANIRVVAYVTMEYKARFTDPKTLAAS